MPQRTRPDHPRALVTHSAPCPIQVLVVDDSPAFRAAAAALLVALGDVDVLDAAALGAEGVEAVRTLAPDLVLMDMNIPGMNGLAAMPEIKCPWYRAVALEGGADGCLGKQSFADECPVLLARLVSGSTPAIGSAQ